jgi:hypothetical protein
LVWFKTNSVGWLFLLSVLVISSIELKRDEKVKYVESSRSILN